MILIDDIINIQKNVRVPYLKLWKKVTPRTNSDFVEAIIMGGEMTRIKTFDDGKGLWNIERVN